MSMNIYKFWLVVIFFIGFGSMFLIYCGHIYGNLPGAIVVTLVAVWQADKY